MTTVHHTPIVAGASNDPATVNTPLGQLDAAIVADAAAIAAETAARIAGDNAEASARVSADNAEAAARIAGDNAQAAARIAGDTALGTRIDNLIITDGGDPGPEVSDARLAGNTDGTSPTVLSERLEWIAANAYHPMAYGATGDGAADDRAVFASILSAIGSARAYITIDRPYALASALTVPGNVALRIEPGGMLKIANTVAVTIHGPILAGPYKIFDCSGDVIAAPATVGRVALNSADLDCVYPEWWGAHEDADAAPALLRCIYAANGADCMHLIRATGVYVIQQPINLNTAVANKIRWEGNSRVGGGWIVAVEAGYSVALPGRTVVGGGLNGNYMIRITGSSYINIDGLRLVVYGAINNPNLEMLSLASGSPALEMSYLKNVSFDAYRNAVSGVGPTLKNFMYIDGAGPLQIDTLNCMYGNPILAGSDPTEYGSCVDHPLYIRCSNGLSIRNVNYWMFLASTKGVYIAADSWCQIEGWWHENMLGGNNPEFTISSRQRGTVYVNGVRFKYTNRQDAAGQLVLFKYLQATGGHLGMSDWQLNNIYWVAGALNANDVILDIANQAGTQTATYTVGQLHPSTVVGSLQGVLHLSKHGLRTAGYGSALNTGRTKQIDLYVDNDLPAGGSFSILHDPQLTPIATTARSGCYLLMISARSGADAERGYLAFISYAGATPNVTITELHGGAYWSVAYNAGGYFVVSNDTGGILYDVGYSVVEFAPQNKFTNN